MYMHACLQLNRMRRTQCGGAAAASRHVLPWATPMSPGVTVTTDNSGCRILSLDGGGIRGLIQIEVLSELERLTGRRIRDLFDCIIGTSTGGIIALAIVYCEYMGGVVCMYMLLYMHVYCTLCTYKYINFVHVHIHVHVCTCDTHVYVCMWICTF